DVSRLIEEFSLEVMEGNFSVAFEVSRGVSVLLDGLKTNVEAFVFQDQDRMGGLVEPVYGGHGGELVLMVRGFLGVGYAGISLLLLRNPD
ncbi:MAG: hypothetical protein KDA68_24530, partial [Planctomycetaceae bacterium]|nr:hypothetical protein [Planctomycetaceae bacterium]